MLAFGRMLLAASCLTLAACASGTKYAEVPSGQEEPSSLSSTDKFSVLIEKEREYEKIFREARKQGLISGALRGALVGALISGEGAGAAAGAILGGIIGSNYSIVAADKLLQEREEFLNRQTIVDNVLLAARNATTQTELDAKIVGDAVDKYSKYSTSTDAATLKELSGATITVSRAVELRALVIEESLQEALISENDAQEIRLLLDRQMNAFARIRALQASWDNHADG